MIQLRKTRNHIIKTYKLLHPSRYMYNNNNNIILL